MILDRLLPPLLATAAGVLIALAIAAGLAIADRIKARRARHGAAVETALAATAHARQETRR